MSDVKGGVLEKSQLAQKADEVQRFMISKFVNKYYVEQEILCGLVAFKFRRNFEARGKESFLQLWVVTCIISGGIFHTEQEKIG